MTSNAAYRRLAIAILGFDIATLTWSWTPQF
jgi:hypothetical protein